MMTNKKVDYQMKVVELAKQWGIDPIKIKPAPNDDGFTFVSAQSGDIYFTIPDKGILVNTKHFLIYLN